jgi:hypothetical protein
VKRWWYVLIGPLTLGILAWVAFLFMGVRGRKPLWLAYAGIYLAVAVAGAVLTELEGEDASFSGFIWIALMGASLAHTLALRGAFEERMEMLDDPALDAAEDAADRREHAREIVASDPARARELGIGRPDLPQSFHAGVIDVNGAPPEWIARVGGLSSEVVDLIAAGRPYSSLEDMDLVVNLPPRDLERLRDVAVFIPSG